jgi:hypothetical protein
VSRYRIQVRAVEEVSFPASSCKISLVVDRKRRYTYEGGDLGEDFLIAQSLLRSKI